MNKLQRGLYLVVACAWFGWVLPAGAGTVTWNGGLSGTWSNPASWSPAAVPVAGDDVIVNGASGTVVSLTANTAGSLSSITVGSNNTIRGKSLSNVSRLGQGTNLFNAGTLENLNVNTFLSTVTNVGIILARTGTTWVTFSGAATLMNSGGAISAVSTGTMNVLNGTVIGGQVFVDSSSTLVQGESILTTYTNVVFTNAGTIKVICPSNSVLTSTRYVILDLRGGTVLDNTGTVDLRNQSTNAAATYYYVCVSNTATLRNRSSGLINVERWGVHPNTNPPAYFYLGSPGFQNDGTITIKSSPGANGSAQWRAPSVDFTNAGTILVTGAVASIQMAGRTLTQTAGALGIRDGGYVVAGTVAINGGTLSGNGAITAAVVIADSASAILYPNNGAAGGTLTCGGNLTFSGTNAVAKFDLSASAGSGNDKVVLQNATLTCGGAAVAINSAGSLDTADYVLFDVGSGTISGDFAATPVWLGTAPSNSNSYHISRSSSQVLLHYGSSAMPVATSDSALTTMNTPVTIQVTANDANFTAPIAGVITGAWGSALSIVNGTNVLYTPASNSNGIDQFWYVITNADGLFATGTVSVTVILPLIAGDDAAVTLENTPVTINVTTNDANFVAPIAGVIPGAWGSVLSVTNGTNVVYTPAANSNGMEQFQYVITNAYGLSATGRVAVTVTVTEVVTNPTARIWVGGLAGTWSNTVNWSPAGAPGAADDVVINGASGTVVSLSANTAVSLSSIMVGSNNTIRGKSLSNGSRLGLSTNLFNAGTLENVNVMQIQNTITNVGIIQARTGTTWVTFLVTGPGSVLMNSGGLISAVSTGSMNLLSGTVIGGQVFVDSSSTLVQGESTLTIYTNVVFTNEGTIRAICPSNSVLTSTRYVILDLRGGTVLDNAGTVDIRNQSTNASATSYYVGVSNTATLRNRSSGLINVERWGVHPNTNPPAYFFLGSPGFENDGTITIKSSPGANGSAQWRAPSVDFTNAGTILVTGAVASIQMAGRTLTQTAGSLEIRDGGCVVAGTVAINGGTLVGNGTITGNVTLASGVIRAWDYTNGVSGAMIVAGTLTLPAIATVHVPANGPLPDPAPVFTATTLAGAHDISGWAVTGANGYVTRIVGNSVVLLKSQGPVFSIR